MYYRNIHPAHPFVLHFSMYQANRAIFPTHLRNAMCFIASHHSSEPSDTCREKMISIFDSSDDGFKVQSLILLTLVSYARFERDQGNKALTAATNLALRINLNSNTFAYDQDPVLQKSWRRTWWELYTITGLIALIGGMPVDPRLVHPDHLLPTHCEAYSLCQIPPLHTSAEMQSRFSTETPFTWSSFAYRIEAMRLLRSILSLPPSSPDSRCAAAQASISSFLLSIPPEKRDGIKPDGGTDETMSCALMIIHLASITLRLPRSPLASVRGFHTVCGTARGALPLSESRTHHAGALRSAAALSELISAGLS